MNNSVWFAVVVYTTRHTHAQEWFKWSWPVHPGEISPLCGCIQFWRTKKGRVLCLVVPCPTLSRQRGAKRLLDPLANVY